MIYWNWHALIGPLLSFGVFGLGLVIQGILIDDSSKKLANFFGADEGGKPLVSGAIEKYRRRIERQIGLTADAVQVAAVALTVPFATIFLFTIPSDLRYALAVVAALASVLVALLVTRLSPDTNHLWRYFSWTSLFTAIVLIIYAGVVFLFTPTVVLSGGTS